MGDAEGRWSLKGHVPWKDRVGAAQKNKEREVAFMNFRGCDVGMTLAWSTVRSKLVDSFFRHPLMGFRMISVFFLHWVLGWVEV